MRERLSRPTSATGALGAAVYVAGTKRRFVASRLAGGGVSDSATRPSSLLRSPRSASPPGRASVTRRAPSVSASSGPGRHRRRSRRAPSPSPSSSSSYRHRPSSTPRRRRRFAAPSSRVLSLSFIDASASERGGGTHTARGRERERERERSATRGSLSRPASGAPSS